MSDLYIGLVENVVGDTHIFWFYRRVGKLWIKIHEERCHSNARKFTLQKVIKNANVVALGASR